MIKALIAEDELLARERLVSLLQKQGDFQVVGACANGRATISQVKETRPDVLFLDVEMPGIDGFGVLDELDREQPPIIVFTTAHAQYAVRAFDIQAQDYLLKPFDEDRFQQALSRVRAQISARRHNGGGGTAAQKGERILVKSGGRILFLRVREIQWIEAAANYVRLYVGDQSHLLREKIGAMEERLDSNLFVRIHRSFIVNAEHIREIQPCGNSEYLLVLKNGRSLPVGRSYWNHLDHFLQDQTESSL
ncbi:MAG TPA: LytTR family DNA-binding domain-containing protein [Candidatus Angelobacter sp.]